MLRRVCRWREEGGKGVGDAEQWLRGAWVRALASVVEARASHSHSKKRTGSVGCPFWEKLFTGWLRFERFLHLRELQLCFGQGFHYESLCVFRCQIASGGHFTDQEILSAL